MQKGKFDKYKLLFTPSDNWIDKIFLSGKHFEMSKVNCGIACYNNIPGV